MQILIESGWSLKEDVWQNLTGSASEASLQEVVLDMDLRKV